MKLTIYIPTFQRTELLFDLLKIIEPQIVDGVEVYVSDNDGSADVVVAEFPQIKYIKRWSNIGCDGNCLAGLSTGIGEYVWVLGDDDRPAPWAVEKILAELNGIDRLILTSTHSGENLCGFAGTIGGLIDRLSDKSFLVASTLCSMNVWRRDAMNPWLALDKTDTRNVLAWAGLWCDTVKVSGMPSVWVGLAEGVSFAGFDVTMNEYVRELYSWWGRELPEMEKFYRWNYMNVTRK
jgi:glycosyltransferase involved in cell wall biosynthesis